MGLLCLRLGAGIALFHDGGLCRSQLVGQWADVGEQDEVLERHTPVDADTI